MKTIVSIVLLALPVHVFGTDKTSFKTAQEPQIGQSSGFKLKKDSRAVLKIGDQNYIILELIDSSREDGKKTFTEACSISWTLISSDSIQADTTNVFIRYRSEETEENSFFITAIGGSDSIALGGDVSIRWSYASPKAIFLYPPPGTMYATTNVEQIGADQPATAPQSKSEGKMNPVPKSEARPQ